MRFAQLGIFLLGTASFVVYGAGTRELYQVADAPHIILRRDIVINDKFISNAVFEMFEVVNKIDKDKAEEILKLGGDVLKLNELFLDFLGKDILQDKKNAVESWDNSLRSRLISVSVGYNALKRQFKTFRENVTESYKKEEDLVNKKILENIEHYL